jgi:hypothetical protein
LLRYKETEQKGRPAWFSATVNKYYHSIASAFISFAITYEVVCFHTAVGCYAALLWTLSVKLGDIPPMGKLLSPYSGFWQNNESGKISSEILNLPGIRDDVTSTSTITWCRMCSQKITTTSILHRASFMRNTGSGKWNFKHLLLREEFQK